MKEKRNQYLALNVVKGFLIFLAVILHSKDFFHDSIRAFDIINKWGILLINPFFMLQVVLD